MFADEDPFRFVSSEVLTRIWHAEFNVLTELLEKHPDFRNLLDAPEATVLERTACFALLAHRELVGMINEKFVARVESPSLDDVESNTLKRTCDLVSADAPAWVREMNRVVERLPVHIYTSLPEPLRMGGFNPHNAEQMQAIESAKKTIGNVEQIQALIERVLRQQLQRLSRRWSVAGVQGRGPNKRKGWEQREKLYEAIRRALKANPSLEGIELCAELDKRHAPPLYDWESKGDGARGLPGKKPGGTPVCVTEFAGCAKRPENRAEITHSPTRFS